LFEENKITPERVFQSKKKGQGEMNGRTEPAETNGRKKVLYKLNVGVLAGVRN